MEHASKAYVLRHTGGSEEERRRLNREAWKLEREAAMAFVAQTGPDVEPTRSVLFRSAACLAVDCGEFEDALTLVRMGLTEHTPPEIAEELREAEDGAKAGGFRR